jgi:hypothetical protein
MTLSKFTTRADARRFRSRAKWATALLALFLAGLLLTLAGGATAAATAVSLGTADSFAILAGTPNITDVPTSVITGDVGLNPGPGSGIGLTCAEVTGTIYSVDATGPLPCRVTDPSLLTTAKTDLTTAYTNAAAEIPDTTFLTTDNQLGGQVLGPGVYNFGHGTTDNLTGNLTLNGDANAVWVFQATSDLVTASSSTITLTGGAQPCNVYWEVGSSATLGTNSTFAGTIMALTNISVLTDVTLSGRVLAQNGAITLDADTITRSACATPPPSTTTTTTTTTTDTTPTPTPPPATTAAATTTVAAATIPTPTVATTTVRTVTRTTAAAKAAAAKAAAAKVAATRAFAERAVSVKARAAKAVRARTVARRAAAARLLALHRAAVARAAKAAAVKKAAAARGHARPAIGAAGFTG